MFGAWPLYTYDGHGEFTQPTTLALREDGAIAATGRWTGEVDVWNFPDGERLHTFDHGEGGSARDIHSPCRETCWQSGPPGARSGS